jgi:hypothetical protein
MRFLWTWAALAGIACGSSGKPADNDPSAADPLAVAAPRPAGEPAVTPGHPVAEPPPWHEDPPPPPPSAPRPHVLRALAQIPADARFVAGVDVPRLAKGALGELMRGAFSKLMSSAPPACSSLGPASFGEVVAAGSGEGGKTGGAIVVFPGRGFQERQTVSCLRDVMKRKGGALERKQASGRTVYFATGTPDDNGWLTWTQAGDPILAGSEAWLTATLDPQARKLAPALAELASRADHGRMIWAAAEIRPDHLRAWGLPDGLIASPVAVRAGVDATVELDLELLVTCRSAAEAQALGAQLHARIAQVRQDPQLAALVKDARLSVYGAELRATLHLDSLMTSALAGAVHLK